MDDTTFSTAPPDGVWDRLNKSAGARLKQLRQAAGLTPSDLMHRLAARGIRLHPTQIGRIEDGSRVLRLDEALAVAAIFGIEMSALIEGTHDLEIAALELQQQDALAALNFRREMFNRFERLFDEVDRARNELKRESEHFTALVHDLEQRIANINDGEIEEDLADPGNGYEEI